MVMLTNVRVRCICPLLLTFEDTDISTSIDDWNVSDDEEIDDYLEDNNSDDEDNH